MDDTRTAPLPLKYEPGHTEHTDDCMDEWSERRRGYLAPELVELNHRFHIHDAGIHVDCPPSCPIGAMWDEAVSYDDRLAAFDIKRKVNRCPSCNAAPGKNCVSLDDETEVKWIHWSRYPKTGA
jgi:hypothetical protein